jgi:hypothetical protein
MTEFFSSFSKWFGEKANSPLYWTYFGFLIAWNWRFFQIIFLEDASLFYAPRVEYLETIAVHPTSIAALDWFINIVWHIGPPAAFTYAAIVWLPQIHHWAFEIYTENLFVRKLSFHRRKVRYEEDLAGLTKKEATAKKTLAEQRQAIEKTKTQEEKWIEEFEKIRRVDLLHGFQRFVGQIYQQGGSLFANQAKDYLSPSANNVEIITFSGTHDLIHTVERKYGNSTASFIEVTDKGKFFSRLLADKGVPVK